MAFIIIIMLVSSFSLSIIHFNKIEFNKLKTQ